MLLLTPVERWQVIVAKSLAVLMFLVLAVALGGLFLQMDLWVARAITESPTLIWDTRPASTALVETGAALQLLVMTFLANLAMVGYFVLFSLFAESPVLMAFISLIVLMTMQTYVLMAPYLTRLDVRYGEVARWCFTRHLSKLTEISTVQGILERRLSLASPEVWQPMLACLGWAALFFLLAMLIFRRKQILT
jgi:ABC-type transport system involved in multi-copper enzyme maturation permease subunit